MQLWTLTDWLDDTYPTRDWDQWCQRLAWNVVYRVSGIRESEMIDYPTATAARQASRIESTDRHAAPNGAIHYWRYPADGHVGVSLGGELVLMTGTEDALKGGVMIGNNYGLTTVTDYTNARGNPYLGWSRTLGRNPSIVGKLTLPSTTPNPAPAEKEEDEMTVRQLHCKEEGRILRALHVPGTAYFVPWTERSSTYANGFAEHWETGDSVEVTPSLFHALRRGAEALLPVDRFAVELVQAEPDA